jgi:hypothetical protein
VDEGPLAVADRRAEAGDVIVVAPVGRGAEVELGSAEPGRVDQARVEAGGVVLAAEAGGAAGARQIVDVGGEDAGLGDGIAGRPGRRQAEAALEVERVGEGGPLHEGEEARAGQLLQRLEVVVLAKREAERLRGLVVEEGVGDLDLVVGEIDLELVAEAAGDAALDADAGAAHLAGEAEAAIGDAARARDMADIVLEAAERPERNLVAAAAAAAAAASWR